jgi:DNA-binding GntR family transcriptional regulator
MAYLLRDRILRFELKPGERLTETGLAQLLSVSRTPVREALQKLEHAGLVARDGRGYCVRKFDLREMDELWDIREALERLAIVTLAQSLSPDKLKRLHEVWDEFPENGDPEQALTCDEKFHLTIAKLSGNRALLSYLQHVNERIHVIRRIDFDDERRFSATKAEHERVVVALKRGQAAEAERHLLENIRGARSNIQRLAKEGLAHVYL